MNERQPNKRGLYAPCADTPGVHLLERKESGREHSFLVTLADDTEKGQEYIITTTDNLRFRTLYNNYDAVVTETYCGWTDNGRKFVNRFEFKIKDGKVFRWGEIDYAKAKTLKKAYRKMIYGD